MFLRLAACFPPTPRPGGRWQKTAALCLWQGTRDWEWAAREAQRVKRMEDAFCPLHRCDARARLCLSSPPPPHWLDVAAFKRADGVRGGTREAERQSGRTPKSGSHAIAFCEPASSERRGPSLRLPTPPATLREGVPLSLTHMFLSPVLSSSLPDAPLDPTLREITVTCPDATGAACDVARCLLDCGLRLVRGDVSVDGRWCYMVLTVAAPPPDFDARGGSSSRRGAAASLWPLVKARLDAVVPRVGDAGGAAASAGLPALRGGGLPAPPAAHASSPSLPAATSTFTVRVQTVDRVGVLHAIVDALWDADLTVLAASAGGGGGGETELSVDDTFIVTDNRATVTSGGASSSSASASARGLRGAASAATPADDSGSICLPSATRVTEVEAAVRAAVDGAVCRVAIVSSPTPPSPASAAAVVPPPTESDRSLPRRCAATAASCSLAAAAAARRAPATDSATTPTPPMRSWSLDGDDDALESVGGRAVPEEAGGGWSADGWAGARGGVRVDVDNTTARAYTVLTVVSGIGVVGREEDQKRVRVGVSLFSIPPFRLLPTAKACSTTWPASSKMWPSASRMLAWRQLPRPASARLHLPLPTGGRSPPRSRRAAARRAPTSTSLCATPTVGGASRMTTWWLSSWPASSGRRGCRCASS